MSYSLTDSDNFLIPRINTSIYGKHSIRYIGPVIWCKLSVLIKSSATLASFKNQVRKVVIENLYELTPVRTVTCVTLINNN